MSHYKRLLLLVVVAVALASAAQWQGGVGERTMSQVEAAFPGPDSLQISSQQCLPNGSVRVNFSWTAYGNGPQWIDLSLFNNGFAPQTFIGLGPLAPNQNQFTWDGLLPSATHFARINALVGGFWYPSNTAGFITIPCAPSPGPSLPGASNLIVVSQSCLDNGRVRLSASWTSSNNGEQWLDLSLTNNGWVNGT